MMTHMQRENPNFHKHGEGLRIDSQQEQLLGPLARGVGLLGNSSRGKTATEPDPGLANRVTQCLLCHLEVAPHF